MRGGEVRGQRGRGEKGGDRVVRGGEKGEMVRGEGKMEK